MVEVKGQPNPRSPQLLPCYKDSFVCFLGIAQIIKHPPPPPHTHQQTKNIQLSAKKARQLSVLQQTAMHFCCIPLNTISSCFQLHHLHHQLWWFLVVFNGLKWTSLLSLKNSTIQHLHLISGWVTAQPDVSLWVVSSNNYWVWTNAVLQSR